MVARLRTFAAMAKAVRFAAWLLPPHREEWAEAMLNEMAYIGSRQAALHWALGCTWSAIRERTSYELGRTFMKRRALGTLLGLGAASLIAVFGIYALQKPYQRERILMVVFHGAGSPAAAHEGSTR